MSDPSAERFEISHTTNTGDGSDALVDIRNRVGPAFEAALSAPAKPIRSKNA